MFLLLRRNDRLVISITVSKSKKKNFCLHIMKYLKIIYFIGHKKAISVDHFCYN